MKIFDPRLRISDSLKISDLSNSLEVLQHPQQYAYARRKKVTVTMRRSPTQTKVSSKAS